MHQTSKLVATAQHEPVTIDLCTSSDDVGQAHMSMDHDMRSQCVGHKSNDADVHIPFTEHVQRIQPDARLQQTTAEAILEYEQTQQRIRDQWREASRRQRSTSKYKQFRTPVSAPPRYFSGQTPVTAGLAGAAAAGIAHAVAGLNAISSNGGNGNSQPDSAAQAVTSQQQHEQQQQQVFERWRAASRQQGPASDRNRTAPSFQDTPSLPRQQQHHKMRNSRRFPRESTSATHNETDLGSSSSSDSDRAVQHREQRQNGRHVYDRRDDDDQYEGEQSDGLDDFINDRSDCQILAEGRRNVKAKFRERLIYGKYGSSEDGGDSEGQAGAAAAGAEGRPAAHRGRLRRGGGGGGGRGDSTGSSGSSGSGTDQKDDVLADGPNDSDAAAVGGRTQDEGQEGNVPLSQAQQQRLRYTWYKADVRAHFWQYLLYLLLCIIDKESTTNFKAIMYSRHPTGRQLMMRISAEKIEGMLMEARSQSTVSTWVSAAPALAKALSTLPQMIVRRLEYSKADQRCALCYRSRHGGLRRIVLQGCPIVSTGYLHDQDSFAGIKAPRKGERATSDARKFDIKGDQQFGGSSDDTGSSTTDEDEAHWTVADWQELRPYQIYGSQRARRARRHSRKGRGVAAGDSWAFDGKLPPHTAAAAAAAVATGAGSAKRTPRAKRILQKRRQRAGLAATAAAADNGEIIDEENLLDNDYELEGTEAVTASGDGDISGSGNNSSQGEKAPDNDGTGSDSQQQQQQQRWQQRRRGSTIRRRGWSRRRKASSHSFIVSDSDTEDSAGGESEQTDSGQQQQPRQRRQQQQQMPRKQRGRGGRHKMAKIDSFIASSSEEAEEQKPGSEKEQQQSQVQQQPRHTAANPGSVAAAAAAVVVAAKESPPATGGCRYITRLSARKQVDIAPLGVRIASALLQQWTAAKAARAARASAAGAAAGCAAIPAAAAGSIARVHRTFLLQGAISSTDSDTDGEMLSHRERQLSALTTKQQQGLYLLQRQQGSSVAAAAAVDAVLLQDSQGDSEGQAAAAMAGVAAALSSPLKRCWQAVVANTDSDREQSMPLHQQQQQSQGLYSVVQQQAHRQVDSKATAAAAGAEENAKVAAEGHLLDDGLTPAAAGAAAAGTAAAQELCSSSKRRRQVVADSNGDGEQATGLQQQRGQRTAVQQQTQRQLDFGVAAAADGDGGESAAGAADSSLLDDNMALAATAELKVPGRAAAKLCSPSKHRRRAAVSDSDQHDEHQQQQQQQQAKQGHGEQQQKGAGTGRQQQQQQNAGNCSVEVSTADEQQRQAHEEGQQQQHAAGGVRIGAAEARQWSLSHKQGYRRRGFIAGAGTCTVRCRAHHLLQHWRLKVSQLLEVVYTAKKVAQAEAGWTDEQIVEDTVKQVYRKLYKHGFRGLKAAAVLLGTMATREGLAQTQQGRELLSLLGKAEEAITGSNDC